MDSPGPPRARPPWVSLALVAASIIVADQVTKAIALARLSPGVPEPVIDGVLSWTLQRNPGAAFGLFARFPVVFTVTATAISIWIVVIARSVADRMSGLALGLILGGAIGNLVDRVVRPPGMFRGHVIDFIDLQVWPVFNIADSAVVIGAALLFIASVRAERRARGARHEAAAAEAPENHAAD